MEPGTQETEQFSNIFLFLLFTFSPSLGQGLFFNLGQQKLFHFYHSTLHKRDIPVGVHTHINTFPFILQSTTHGNVVVSTPISQDVDLTWRTIVKTREQWSTTDLDETFPKRNPGLLLSPLRRQGRFVLRVRFGLTVPTPCGRLVYDKGVIRKRTIWKT